jgi:hypothetical protein
MTTSQTNNGGYVHPTPMVVTPTGELMPTTCYGSFGGMSLRDWFAGQAIGHLAAYSMQDGWARSGPEWRDGAASEAYKFADAMIEAREEINATLFDEVKKLQDIKRKHEENELRMAHEIDQLRAALLAMHEFYHYSEYSISGSLLKQVEAALQIVS